MKITCPVCPDSAQKTFNGNGTEYTRWCVYKDGELLEIDSTGDGDPPEEYFCDNCGGQATVEK